MAHHFEIIEKLSGLGPAAPFDVNEPADRVSLVGTLLHAADISNPLIPDFQLVEKWVSLEISFSPTLFFLTYSLIHSLDSPPLTSFAPLIF